MLTNFDCVSSLHIIGAAVLRRILHTDLLLTMHGLDSKDKGQKTAGASTLINMIVKLTQRSNFSVCSNIKLNSLQEITRPSIWNHVECL